VALAGGIIIILYLLGAVFAPQITRYDPTRGNLRLRLQPPAWLEEGSWDYPLGADAQGRDLLTRIIFGARVSLLVGGLSVSISVLLGGTLGALAGYYRGRLDAIVSRLADLLLAFPFLIFAIGVMALWVQVCQLIMRHLQRLGGVLPPGAARMMAEKTQEYVEAARVQGWGTWRSSPKKSCPTSSNPSSCWVRCAWAI
jgi:ABC-type dipeptide/oligopeptide/nickel transport system permease subunit